jgi:hypothetical protein
MDDKDNKFNLDEILGSNINPGNLGEALLKSSALTMSSKGISQDLKDVIKMKVDFISSIYSETSHLSEIFLSGNNNKAAKEALSKDGILTKTLDHILAEIFATNITLDNILINFIKKEQNIQEDSKKLIISNIEAMINREIAKFSK